MCNEWLDDYFVFKRWAYENGYRDGLTIDRIDSSGGYNPNNCRWITLSENSARANVGIYKNKSKLEYAYAISPVGEKVEITNILKFSETYGLNRSNVNAALHGRISSKHQGWTFVSPFTREGVTTIESA